MSHLNDPLVSEIAAGSTWRATRHTKWLLATMAAIATGSAALAGPTSTVVGFDGGDNGGFTGNAFFEAAGGNPGGNAHHLLTVFFNELRTGGLGEPANPAFLGDYSPFTDITIGFDIKVDSLTDFIGNQIARPLGIALIDRDIMGPNGSSGVFFELAVISAASQPDWTHLSVTIADPTQTTLPAGWIGFGDEDPNTFETILPPGATFASVLAGVDEMRITGAVPGFFFTNANFDVRIDNVSISVVPSGPDCDFDNDGDCDIDDIDALIAEIVAGTNNPAFDLNGDGAVTLDDLDAWLAEAGAANLPSGNPYLLGDANLDGFVGGQDFIAWNASKFTAVAAWSAGDFNADGFADGLDFIIWNTNKFQSSGAP